MGLVQLEHSDAYITFEIGSDLTIELPLEVHMAIHSK